MLNGEPPAGPPHTTHDLQFHITTVTDPSNQRPVSRRRRPVSSSIHLWPQILVSSGLQSPHRYPGTPFGTRWGARGEDIIIAALLSTVNWVLGALNQSESWAEVSELPRKNLRTQNMEAVTSRKPLLAISWHFPYPSIACPSGTIFSTGPSSKNLMSRDKTSRISHLPETPPEAALTATFWPDLTRRVTSSFENSLLFST